ncbi:peroxidase [Irpex rosettiformis]|uniref:Peroxidase n=1 Tax=Irpex rosettiformis TaxID=378272 RepID=A0ACB8TW93_9APHY|nr:peroxidase [Irpex rosettiformis]
MRFISLLGIFLAFPALNCAAGAVHDGLVRHKLGKGTVRKTPLLAAFTGHPQLPTLQQILGMHPTQSTLLSIDNIQGDILVGMKKQKERFVFFHVNNAAEFKSVLKAYTPTNITSASTLVSPASDQPLAFVNIAFSHTGLSTLDINDNLGDSNFVSGQFAGASRLGDDTATWEPTFKGTDIHGVFLIGTDKDEYLETYTGDLKTLFGSSWSVSLTLDAAARPGAEAGHEHFGFLDGISNPAVVGFNNPLPGQTSVPPGIILTGNTGDRTNRPAWAKDGSFMVFRKLKQLVPEFNKWTLDNAIQNRAGNLTIQEGAEFLSARMIGRWKSGAPIDVAPEADDPALGADPNRNNNFDYAHPGSSLASDQTNCPFSAHLRKVNPRADQGNTNTVNHAIRAGTPYGPEVSDDEANSNSTQTDRGLAFVMYQSNIANGFRFQQVNWANTADFPAGKNVTPGIEPIIGQGSPRVASGLDPLDSTKTYTLPNFVVSNGGEYFFVPSISAITDKIAA